MSADQVTIKLICKPGTVYLPPPELPISYCDATGINQDNLVMNTTNWPFVTTNGCVVINSSADGPNLTGIDIYVKVQDPDLKLPCFDINTLEPGDPSSIPPLALGNPASPVEFLLCIPNNWGTIPQAGGTNALVEYWYTLVCVRGDTLVQTPRGQVAIADLCEGDFVIDHRGQAQRITHNLKTGSTEDFVKIKRGALGKEQPSADLYIRHGHPVLVDGKEVLCEQLIDGGLAESVKLEKPANLYTLCTGSRTFVEMQGIQVGTWSEAAMENFVQNDRVGQGLKLNKQ